MESVCVFNRILVIMWKNVRVSLCLMNFPLNRVSVFVSVWIRLSFFPVKKCKIINLFFYFFKVDDEWNTALFYTWTILFFNRVKKGSVSYMLYVTRIHIIRKQFHVKFLSLFCISCFFNSLYTFSNFEIKFYYLWPFILSINFTTYDKYCYLKSCLQFVTL